MLQRANFVMMILLLLFVVAVGVQVMLTQRHNTLALQAITADLAQLKNHAAISQQADAKLKAITDLLHAALASVDARSDTPVDLQAGRDRAASGAVQQSRDHPDIASRSPEAIATAPSNAPPADDHATDAAGELPQRSPFRSVRWQDNTPFVNIEGVWGELLSINDVPTARIVAFCAERYGVLHRRHFSEELIHVLSDMGEPLRDPTHVKLQIREHRSGAEIAIEQAALTEANHLLVLLANDAAAAGNPPYPVWTGAAQ